MFASGSSEAWLTSTSPARGRRGLTRAIVLAWRRRARIEHDLTVLTGEAGQTIARVRADHVTTQAVVLTRLRQEHALVDVHLAVGARPAVRASALVPVRRLHARARVQTRLRLTQVHVGLAVAARPAFY